MKSREVIPAFQDARERITGQVGRKPIRQDLAEMGAIIQAALIILMQSPTNYRDWFRRCKFEDAFRDWPNTYLNKRWNKFFCRFLVLVESDLAAWNRELPRLPIDPPKRKRRRAA